jgi:hypothetical protein
VLTGNDRVVAGEERSFGETLALSRPERAESWPRIGSSGLGTAAVAEP